MATQSLLEQSCISSACGWDSPGRASRRRGARMQVTEMRGPVAHAHTLWLYLCRASLSRRGLGDNQPRRGSSQLLGPQEAGIGRGS